jgi:hypothetical protein
MPTLQELHETFRREDAKGRAARREKMLRRAAGEPDAQRGCEKAIRHDARDNGTCRWCGAKCEAPTPKPKPPYSMNQGDVLKDEAYRYFWGNDDVDLPSWYQRAGQIYAGWDL